MAAFFAALMATPLPVMAPSDDGSSPSGTTSSTERPFDRLDKNKDGSLSMDEVKDTSQEKDFAKLDKNRDGKLSRQEYGGEKAGTGATAGSAGSGVTAGSKPPRSGTSTK